MKVFLFAVLIAAAVAAPQDPKAAYPQQQAYQKPSNEYPPMPYNFAWAVKDDPSYNDYAHQESSDGKVVSGSYRVLLPDGRTQIVTYKADDNGYVADVQYQGQAKYDTQAYNKQAASSYPKSS